MRRQQSVSGDKSMSMVEGRRSEGVEIKRTLSKGVLENASKRGENERDIGRVSNGGGGGGVEREDDSRQQRASIEQVKDQEIEKLRKKLGIAVKAGNEYKRRYEEVLGKMKRNEQDERQKQQQQREDSQTRGAEEVAKQVESKQKELDKAQERIKRLERQVDELKKANEGMKIEMHGMEERIQDLDMQGDILRQRVANAEEEKMEAMGNSVMQNKALREQQFTIGEKDRRAAGNGE
ncbi:hypothetical protein AX774_g4139 [Zancudomyces culisetae]|uniref:Uncharacterized protein n=1 Tax=Zancudomyces culisetae TaxID=1213189 RepID=A0A1R1PN30_ZANCU|nr:hypothetical protein AX774_g4139 [Zancudomyces culisetae]|eukprot:OMH82377.1 hypothetical protein AX774_g4139 [Zancudomyces culisetae]